MGRQPGETCNVMVHPRSPTGHSTRSDGQFWGAEAPAEPLGGKLLIQKGSAGASPSPCDAIGISSEPVGWGVEPETNPTRRFAPPLRGESFLCLSYRCAMPRRMKIFSLNKGE